MLHERIQVPASEDLSSVWIVIPGFNESGMIARTIRSVAHWLPNVVVVDDGSTDETGREAERAGARVVRHCVNLGQGAALGTGIRYALLNGARNIVTFDADGQHRPEDIGVLLRRKEETGADVVLGSRFLGSTVNMPTSRRWLLRAATFYTRLTTGLNLTDAHNGLRLLTRRAAKQLRIRQNRMAHASELLDWLASSDLKVVEAPVNIVYTDYTLAKGQDAFSSFNILWDLWSSRLHR
ncbi:MAG: glycosyltransferase family 2 protein [Alphaproteobacteria bacterium]|nr:glycosyltransferase family 2 protein [Alphaproteobacteria bacterium]